MQRRIFLQVVMVGTVSAKLDCLNEEAWAAEQTLEAKNAPDPCPVNKPRHNHIQNYPYVWYYRTEVRNHLKVPLRIVSFACYAWIRNQWVPTPNILKRPLGSKEFMDWYSDGDIPHDGWIAPGKTAVCDPNWNYNKTGIGMKYKWVYHAKDAHGKRYQAEALVKLHGATVPKHS